MNGKKTAAIVSLAALLILCTVYACAPEEGVTPNVPGANPSTVFYGTANYEQGDGVFLPTGVQAGAPAVGARVRVEGTPFSDLVDENGGFRIRNLPPGKHKVVVEKDLDGDGLYEQLGHSEIEVKKGANLYKDMPVPPAGRIVGRVTLDGAETGNGGISVCLEGAEACAVTNDRGYYELRHITCKREWTVVADKVCYAPAVAEDVYVNCGIGIPVYLPDMDMAYNGCPWDPVTGSLSGRAMLTDSDDSSGILITLSDGSSARTAADGSYSFAELAQGAYDLSADLEGYIPEAAYNLAVVAGQATAAPDLYLAPKALPDCDGDGVPNIDDPDDDNDGYTDVDELAYGSDTCDPASKPLGGIEGTVADQDSGAPLANAMVSVEGTGLSAVTGADGAFSLSGVHAGPAVLLAQMSNYDSAEALVEVVAGATVYVEMALAYNPPNTAPVAMIVSPADGSVLSEGEAIDLSGTVYDGEDAPETLLVRWTSSLDGSLGTSVPAADGSVTLSGVSLSAGTHTLIMTVLDPGQLEGSDSAVVEVTPASPAQLCLDRAYFDFGPATQALPLNIWNCGGGTLDWSIASNQTWATATPSSGSVTTDRQTVSIAVDRTGLRPGQYQANLTVSSNGGNTMVVVRIMVY